MENKESERDRERETKMKTMNGKAEDARRTCVPMLCTNEHTNISE